VRLLNLLIQTAFQTISKPITDSVNLFINKHTYKIGKIAMKPLIFHNPKCGTSRNTLAIMNASGEQPDIVEYLQNPPTRDYLVELLAKMSISPRELLRSKEPVNDELGLNNPELSDDQIIDAMIAHPILINRPIVVTNKGAALCRPSERVFELL
jgi:arsenate reductase